MTSQTRRRRFVFSLRMLFLVMTLSTMGAWMTMRALNERRRVRDWIDRDGGVMLYYNPKDDFEWHNALAMLSWFEKALGEKPIRFVGMPHDATDEDEKRLRRILPEMRAIGRCPERAAK